MKCFDEIGFTIINSIAIDFNSGSLFLQNEDKSISIAIMYAKNYNDELFAFSYNVVFSGKEWFHHGATSYSTFSKLAMKIKLQMAEFIKCSGYDK